MEIIGHGDFCFRAGLVMSGVVVYRIDGWVGEMVWRRELLFGDQGIEWVVGVMGEPVWEESWMGI